MMSLKGTAHQLKRSCAKNYITIAGAFLFFVTLLYFKISGDNELKQAPVLEGKVISCRPVSWGGTRVADIEFRLGPGGLQRKTVKLQKEQFCVAGQKVKVRYAIQYNLIEIIE